MSMFGNLTAGYIRKAIQKEIENTMKSKLTDEAKELVVIGLEKAKKIAEGYED